MHTITRTSFAALAIALAMMGGAAVGTNAIAAANTNVEATGGDGTTVDHDGTQGSFTNSVQGIIDDDGDQDAYLTSSQMATPQSSAAHK